MDKGQIILFQTQGGETKVEVRLADESVWLTADQMAELFQHDKSTISRHIKNILDSGELQRNSVVAENATTMTVQIRKMTDALKKDLGSVGEAQVVPPPRCNR